MNHTQQKYAVSRIDEIYNSKKIKLKEECTTERKVLSNRERVELVRKNKVKIIPTVKIEFKSYDFGLNCVFDFSTYEFAEKLSSTYEGRLSKLTKEYKKISDEIMLGNSIEALNAIKTFNIYNI